MKEHALSRWPIRTGSLALAGCALLWAISSSGCSDERATEVIGVDEASAAAVPSIWSFRELPGSLELTPEQSAGMRDAIDELNHESQRLHEEFRRDRPAHGMGERGSVRGTRPEPPMLTFLESTSMLLNADQFLILCEHLVSQRDQLRDDGIGRRERHGDRINRREHRDESERAERGRDQRRGKGRMSRWVSDDLGLSREQMSELHGVRREYREQSKALLESVVSGSLPADAGVAQAAQLARSMKADLSAILTSEQMATLDETNRNRIDRGIDRRMETLDTKLTRRAEFLARVLQLSEDQTGQAEQIFLASIPERERNLVGVRDGSIDPQVALLMGVQLEQQTVAELRAILTDDQAKRLDAMRDLIPRGMEAGANRFHMHF